MIWIWSFGMVIGELNKCWQFLSHLAFVCLFLIRIQHCITNTQIHQAAENGNCTSKIFHKTLMCAQILKKIPCSLLLNKWITGLAHAHTMDLLACTHKILSRTAILTLQTGKFTTGNFVLSLFAQLGNVAWLEKVVESHFKWILMAFPDLAISSIR